MGAPPLGFTTGNGHSDEVAEMLSAVASLLKSLEGNVLNVPTVLQRDSEDYHIQRAALETRYKREKREWKVAMD